MDDDEAQLIQAGRRTGVTMPEYAERAARARAAGVDQADLAREAPDDLSDHIVALQQSNAAVPYFKEGWRVAIVDLRKVCALQPCVFTDQAEQRAAGIEAGDLRSIAGISLPLPARVELPGQFDPSRQAWILSAPNPNLRIVGPWAGEVQPGLTGLGFTVSVMPSFLQVACYQNRFLLRDGYHRAYGFLHRGITLVPAFVPDYGPFQDLGLGPGLLRPSAWLGDRPPLLTDYTNEAVSAEVMLPASQKMIVIHGLELTPLG
jgi:hypothetical protein